MEIEAKYIKFRSSAINIPIRTDINANTEYVMRGKFSSNGGSFKDNGNGKIDIYYTLTPCSEIEFLDSKKIEVFMGQKEKQTTSKKMKSRLYLYHSEEGLSQDFEEFYEKIGAKMILYMPEIINFLKTKT